MKKIGGRILCASAAVIGFVLLAGGCGKSGDQNKPGAGSSVQPVVKIGHAGPLTGEIAHLGKDNENGVRLAIEEANAKAPTIGGQKVVFELLSEDDEGKEAKGKIIAQKLVDAKVSGVVGHLNSGVTIPASEVYAEAGIPMISGSATNEKVTDRGLKTVFRTVGRDDQQGPAIASFLAAQVRVKAAAVIDDATSYGEGLADQVEKTLKAAGVHVLPREKGTKETRDWKAILTKLKGKKPDAIFYGGMDSGAGPLIKQGRELGIQAVFAFGDGACSIKMYQLAGAASEGMVCSQAGVPVQAAARGFLNAYKSRFNVEPIIYAPFAYDATNLLIAAMQKADSTDPVKYLPELAKISFEGASGKIEFDVKGDRKDAEITIFAMKSGKVEPVAIVKGGNTIRFEDFVKAAAVGAKN